MKLKLKIREMAESKGILTAYQLQKKADLAPSTAYRFFSNKALQISLDTLEKICTALDCDPGEIIVRDGKTTKPKNLKKVD